MAFNVFACSNAESFSQCEDWATLMLTRIFEDVIPFITGAADQPTETRFLGEVFIWFNLWLLIIAGLIASYVAIVGTANTANDGQAMGKQWNSLWTPLRIVTAAAALLPTTTGFSFLQVFVIAIALIGSNAANFINDQALKKAVTPTGFAPALAVTSYSSDNNLISNAFMQGVCAGLYENYYKKIKHYEYVGLNITRYTPVKSYGFKLGKLDWFEEQRKKNKDEEENNVAYFQIVTPTTNKGIIDQKEGIHVPFEDGVKSRVWGVGFGTSDEGARPTITHATNSSMMKLGSFNAVCGSIMATEREFRGFNGATDAFVKELETLHNEIDVVSRSFAATIYAMSGQKAAEGETQYDMVNIGREFVNKFKNEIENCGDAIDTSSESGSASTTQSSATPKEVVAQTAAAIISFKDSYMEALQRVRSTALGCDDAFTVTTGADGSTGLTPKKDGKCNFDEKFKGAMEAQREKTSKYGWTAAVGWFHEISAARAAIANNLLPADIESTYPNVMPPMGGDRETRCVNQILGAAADVVSQAALGEIDMALASGTTTANANEVKQQAQDFTAKKIITTSSAIAAAVIRGLSPGPKEKNYVNTGLSILSQEAQTAEERFRDLAFTRKATDSVSNVAYKTVSSFVLDQMAETCPPSLTGIGKSLYRVQCLTDIAVTFSLGEMTGALANFKSLEGSMITKAALQTALAAGAAGGIELASGASTGAKKVMAAGGAISGNKALEGVAKNAHSIVRPAIFVSAVLPMLPYFVFMFGVLGWILGILQTVVAAPLWAVLHMTPGQSFIGSERQGYLLMMALAVRPMLLIISLYLGYWICDTFIDYYAAAFIKALDAISSTATGINAYGAAGSAMSLITGETSQLSVLFLVFCIGLFAVFGLVFSLAQTLPNAVLRWINVNNEDLGASNGATILQQRMQSAAGVGAYQSAPVQAQQVGRTTGGKDGNPQ